MAKKATAASKQRRKDEAFDRGQREAEASRITSFWREPSQDVGACSNPYPADDSRHAAYVAGWNAQ